MPLIRFHHKGLLQLYTEDNPKRVSASHLEKVRKLLLALETAVTLEQVGRFPGWKLHPLKGDWKLAHCFPLSGTNKHRQRH